MNFLFAKLFSHFFLLEFSELKNKWKSKKKEKGNLNILQGNIYATREKVCTAFVFLAEYIDRDMHEDASLIPNSFELFHIWHACFIY